MTVIAVIPARYESSRFPGKPLVLIAGKPMVVRVWERAREAVLVNRVVVATDDERIASICRDWGAETVMTSRTHATGTDRVAEVAASVPADVYVNVQGDEPVIAPSSIDRVVTCLEESRPRGIEVSTVYLQGSTPEQDASTSVVHLVPALDGTVLTLSRLPVPCAFKAPFRRNVHLGLYAYTSAALATFSRRPPGPVCLSEDIELFRFLEYGDRIACATVSEPSIGIDRPEDVARVEALLAEQGRLQ